MKMFRPPVAWREMTEAASLTCWCKSIFKRSPKPSLQCNPLLRCLRCSMNDHDGLQALCLLVLSLGWVRESTALIDAQSKKPALDLWTGTALTSPHDSRTLHFSARAQGPAKRNLHKEIRIECTNDVEKFPSLIKVPFAQPPPARQSAGVRVSETSQTTDDGGVGGQGQREGRAG